MQETLSRRNMLKNAAAAGAGLLILPTGARLGAAAPGNKLNCALIGVWGRAHAHFRGLEKENVVALCDVDEEHLAGAAKKFPNAKTYVDWRKCLEQKDLDAVVICTTDHTHAHIANWAMNRGLHVYCEKPSANTVEEARIVRATYLKNRKKLATQVGTQRHAIPNFNRVRELIVDGAIGELEAVWAWGNRQLRSNGYLPAEGTPPKTLHYDLWIGPSPYHPYNPGYFSGGPGANCLQWNKFWDFGSGQIGDMGSHTMDLAWNALDADLPTSAEAKGEEFNPEYVPVELTSTFEIPANDWRPAIRVSWLQGVPWPEDSPWHKDVPGLRSPYNFVDLNRIGHGAMFKGDKGYVIADFGKRIVIPFGNDADLSYFDKRPEDEMLPNMPDFFEEWAMAAKGDPEATSCNFDYNAKMTEMMLLGLVAYRAGKKLDYDGATGRVTNDAAANDYLARAYREGWPIDG